MCTDRLLCLGRTVHGVDGRIRLHFFGNRSASVRGTHVPHVFTDVRVHEKPTARARARRTVDVHVRDRRNFDGLTQIG